MDELRQQMCDIGRNIWLRGYCAGNEGNHSVKVGRDRLLCTPTGMSKGAMTPQDICLVDMAGKPVEVNRNGRSPSSELLLHLAIYRTRQDIGAVVHSHPPHATAFAISNIELPEGIHPEAELFLGRVPLAPFAMPSTQALPDSITPLIRADTQCVVMGHHGVVCFGRDLTDAYYKLEILDAYCRILLLAHPLRRISALPDEQLAELLRIKEKFGLKDSRIGGPGEADALSPDANIADRNKPFFDTLR